MSKPLPKAAHQAAFVLCAWYLMRVVTKSYDTMKTMTCTQLGGMCDVKVHGATAEEMIEHGMQHLEEAHPQMAADIKSMPADHPQIVAWSEKFHKDFEATPDDEETENA